MGRAGRWRGWRRSSWVLEGQIIQKYTCFLGGHTGQALLWHRIHLSSHVPSPSPAPGSLQRPLPGPAFQGSPEWVGFKGSPIALPLLAPSQPSVDLGATHAQPGFISVISVRNLLVVKKPHHTETGWKQTRRHPTSSQTPVPASRPQLFCVFSSSRLSFNFVENAFVQQICLETFM